MKPMLAKTYDNQDPTGWLMSEKLDGIRAIWDGSKLVSRDGNEFSAPTWFLAQLPADTMLDGELWIARGAFQKTLSVVRKKTPIAAEWQAVTFRVFDAPAIKGGFEARLAACGTILAGCAIASVVEHTICRDSRHMHATFGALCADGAEGIMLRRPASPYEQKRSSSLLKLKPSDSCEAVLVGSESGDGRISGLVGALVVAWRGLKFKIGTGLDDETRANPPKMGARITFGFCGLTDAGLPRFPTFIAVRNYE
jgi:DNA ligase-1